MAETDSRDEVIDIQKISEEVKFFERARMIIQAVKDIQKTLYQLVFISTSQNPLRDEADKLIKQMIELKLVSVEEVQKAVEDVQRWRRMFLDKIMQ